MPEEIHVGDTTVRTCRNQISCKHKWKYLHSVVQFVQCRGRCAVCRQAHLSPEALRRWRSTPPMWTLKQDSTSPWETASNLIAPSLTSHTEMVLHHGKIDTMKVIYLLSVVGRKVLTLGQGCQVNGHYSCRAGKRRSRWQLASQLHWGITSAGNGLWRSGHGTWNTALLRFLAGSREVSCSLFGRR